MVSVSTGKRAGSRRAAPAPRKVNKAALLIGAAITVCIVAWGYLVYAAIDFGTAAREGSENSAWLFMGLACLGAIACLFVGLLLVAWLMRSLGITSAPADPASPAPPRPVRAGPFRSAVWARRVLRCNFRPQAQADLLPPTP